MCTWLSLYLLTLRAVFRLPDRAINLLFRFLKLFLTVIGIFSSQCKEIASCFPKSLYRAIKESGLQQKNTFTKYVVCRKCHKLYILEGCIDKIGSTLHGKTCTHKRFPNHPQVRMRRPCGTLLVKSVEVATGRSVFYPKLYILEGCIDKIG